MNKLIDVLSKWMLLGLVMASPIVGWAQRPLSGTLTKPGSQTLKYDPRQKPPTLNLPCKMANGVDDRPYACEFRLDRLEIFGKDGSLLATVTRTTPTVSLPIGQAKKTSTVSTMAMITYPAKVYVTRINPPAFPVMNGYLIERSTGAQGTSADFVNTLLTGIQIDTKVGTKKTIAVDLTWPHNTNGEALFGIHIENDVTTNKLKPKPGTVLAMRDKAEATMLVNPKLVKP